MAKIRLCKSFGCDDSIMMRPHHYTDKSPLDASSASLWLGFGARGSLMQEIYISRQPRAANFRGSLARLLAQTCAFKNGILLSNSKTVIFWNCCEWNGTN
ncbi:hypothetical protein K1T71_011854 [Dendrolimus kikuchii]|uniref:Uncharacterized protein n=1 Tax=Dendrolimus kikuchii TaxID=765133 RepID=A0ACC1CM81_9NEOP|nr:hypothetical protein K1T71_011854 [Dendrolimus kikuchii]